MANDGAQIMNRRVSMSKPCTANWEIMPGSDQLRHCSACQRTVYNFSEMTSAEVERALDQSGDRVCARIVQRTDGTIMSRGTERTARWSFAAAAPGIAGAALTALLTAGVAQPATVTPQQQSGLVKIADDQGGKSTLTVDVEDVAGAVVPKAQVTIVSKETLARIVSATNDQGVLQFANLAPGNYDVMVAFAGFATARKSVLLPAREPLKFQLEPGRGGPTVLVGEVVVVHAELTHSPTSEQLVEPSAAQNPPHQDGPVRRFFRKLGRFFS
jgi:Carboxypeptidase regulatory-like domain